MIAYSQKTYKKKTKNKAVVSKQLVIIKLAYPTQSKQQEKIKMYSNMTEMCVKRLSESGMQMSLNQ